MKVVQPVSGSRPPYGVLKHVTESYGLTYSAGRYACAHGLPHVRIGRAIFVKFADMDAWLAAQMVRERAS